MGVGRREFVRLMSLALAGSTVDPLSIVAVNDNNYVNKKLGVMFEKPEGWGFIHVHDFGKLKDAQLMSNIEPDEVDEFWEEMGFPACMVTKYFEDTPDTHGIFSPTIQFFVNHKSEFADLNYGTFENFIELSGLGMTSILKNFRVQKERKTYTFNGCNFHERNALYDFEHVQIDRPLEVRLQVLIAEHNNYFYFINFHDCPTQNQVAEKEFRDFKKSLKLI